MVEVIIDSLRHGTNTWIVVLKDKRADRYLPILIGETQADVLTGELQGRRSVEPDRFLAITNATTGGVKSVTIHLESDTFYAKLLCHHDEEVKCPIGVALALAVRAKVLIWVEDAVLDKAALTLNWDWPWGVADAVIKTAQSTP